MVYKVKNYYNRSGKLNIFQNIDTTPIECSIAELGHINIKLISCTELEPLWDFLVSQNHYLGYQKIIGKRLKYLIFSDFYKMRKIFIIF